LSVWVKPEARKPPFWGVKARLMVIDIPASMCSTTSCTPSACERRGAAHTRLLDNGLGSRFNTRHFDLVAQEHVRYLGVDVVFPMVTLIDRFIQPCPLFLTFKAADPDV